MSVFTGSRTYSPDVLIAIRTSESSLIIKLLNDLAGVSIWPLQNKYDLNTFDFTRITV